MEQPARIRGDGAEIRRSLAGHARRDEVRRLRALIAAGNKLIIQGAKGELVIAEASPEKLKPLARAQVLGGKCWTVPALANGRIYCRNSKGDLVCLDVRGGTH